LPPAKPTSATRGARAHFLRQAEQCEPRSPLYAGLCRRFADDPRALELVDERWDAPLRLLAGLHYLVLSGRASWEDVESAVEGHAGFLRRFVEEQGVQTNEVQRCWVLLPCFLRLAERTGFEIFDLVELGPSAGLNLYWDRYRYRYEAGAWGPMDAPLSLEGAERGTVPPALLQRAPLVRGRAGIDLQPVDVTTEEGAVLLKSFVWADRPERLDRLERAIDALRREPPELIRADFAERLPKVLDAQPRDGLTVVFQTSVFGYVGEEGRSRVRAALDEAGGSRPVAFVTAGRPRHKGLSAWGVRIVLWPGGQREFVGHADFHGTWLDWSPE
jgi:hypothetical protein